MWYWYSWALVRPLFFGSPWLHQTWHHTKQSPLCCHHPTTHQISTATSGDREDRNSAPPTFPFIDQLRNFRNSSSNEASTILVEKCYEGEGGKCLSSKCSSLNNFYIELGDAWFSLFSAPPALQDLFKQKISSLSIGQKMTDNAKTGQTDEILL